MPVVASFTVWWGWQMMLLEATESEAGNFTRTAQKSPWEWKARLEAVENIGEKVACSTAGGPILTCAGTGRPAEIQSRTII